MYVLSDMTYRLLGLVYIWSVWIGTNAGDIDR